METLRNSLKAFQVAWNDASRPMQIAMAAATIMSLAAFIFVAVWSSRPEYVELASALSPAEAGKIRDQLERASITYKLNHSGATILVSRSQLSDARLAAGDSLPLNRRPDDIDQGMFLGDPTRRHDTRLRYAESVLEHSLGDFASIARATVQISKPEPSVFPRDQAETTASVMLTLKPGRHFSEENSYAVVSLVSSSVEGLKPENVHVIDSRGRDISPRGGIGGGISTHLDYRRKLELHLKHSALRMLEGPLGFGRARVEVSVQLDLEGRESTTTVPDSAVKVPTREVVQKDSTTGANSTASGLAGQIRADNGAGTVQQKSELVETDYEVTKTTQIIRKLPGTIRRLSVAVIADLSPRQTEPDADGEAATAAPPQQLTAAEVESLVSSACRTRPVARRRHHRPRSAARDRRCAGRSFRAESSNRPVGESAAGGVTRNRRTVRSHSRLVDTSPHSTRHRDSRGRPVDDGRASEANCRTYGPCVLGPGGGESSPFRLDSESVGWTTGWKRRRRR